MYPKWTSVISLCILLPVLLFFCGTQGWAEYHPRSGSVATDEGDLETMYGCCDVVGCFCWDGGGALEVGWCEWRLGRLNDVI